MTRNETFFKILFAISLALLPMTIFSYLFLPKWAISLFIAGLLLAKIWLELFKDKVKFSHNLIISINSVAVFATLFILFAMSHVINTALAVVVIVAIVLMYTMKLLLFKHNMPEYIDAVDYCFMIFECLTIAGLAIANYYVLITNIGIFALMITALVSVAYKVYFSFKYTKAKNIFKRKK